MLDLTRAYKFSILIAPLPYDESIKGENSEGQEKTDIPHKTAAGMPPSTHPQGPPMSLATRAPR